MNWQNIRTCWANEAIEAEVPLNHDIDVKAEVLKGRNKTIAFQKVRFRCYSMLKRKSQLPLILSD